MDGKAHYQSYLQARILCCFAPLALAAAMGVAGAVAGFLAGWAMLPAVKPNQPPPACGNIVYGVFALAALGGIAAATAGLVIGFRTSKSILRRTREECERHDHMS